MKRIPIIPTLIVAAAVAVMIGLGVWQLRRASEKDQLLQAIQAEGQLPPTIVECRIDAAPEVRAGRSLRGEVGYRYLVPCGATQPDVKLVVGWSRAPDALPRVIVEGRLEALPNGVNRQLLTLATPLPPLEAAAPPDIAEIPNNHLMYAFQWFFFAATAAFIYGLALRRRKR
jgi:surfeit locus 1 family protein